MKPSVQKIVAKLAKEQEKVELSSIKELDRLSREVKGVDDYFKVRIDTYRKAKGELKSLIRGRTQQSIDLLTAIREAENKAEELGVKINVSKYEAILENYYKTVDELDQILR